MSHKQEDEEENRHFVAEKMKQTCMSMAFLAIIMIIAVVGINSISLRQKQAKYIAREQELQQQIDAENARTEELKELETYTKTKKYAEEVAKDKLGLVYDNEIIFKEED